MKTKSVKSSVDKLDVASVKKLARFYFTYAVKNILFLALLAVVFVSFSLLEIILINSDNFLENSVLLVMPFVTLPVFIAFYLSWKLNSASKHDGTALFIFSKKFGRKNNLISKNVTIFIIAIVSLFVQMIFSLIFNFSIGIKSQQAFLFSVVLFFASVFVLAFLMAFAQLITILFNEVISIIILTLIGSIFVVAPLVSNKVTSSSSNELSWNLADNKENYAKVISLDPNLNVSSSEVAVYNSGSKSKNTMDNNEKNIGTNSKYGLFFDKFITSPYSLFSTTNLNVEISNFVKLSKDNDLSLLSINDEFKSDFLTSGNNYVSYGIDDKNPAEETYASVLNAWIENFKNFDKNLYHFDINDSLLMQQFLTRLKTDSKWLSTNLTTFEKEFISKLVGLNKDDALFYYIFRDWNIYSNKFTKIFSDLKANGVNSDFVDLLEYLLTDSNSRNNILKQYMVKSQSEIENLFPMLLAYDNSKTATQGDINKIKSLVSNISSSEVEILNSNDSYVKVSNKTFPWRITSKADWDLMVDGNSSLNNLRKIYSDFKTWTSIEQTVAKEISFEKNSVDFYQFEKTINLTTDANIVSTSIMFTILAVSSIGMFGLGYVLNSRKDIK